jgi:hypothetical protein
MKTNPKTQIKNEQWQDFDGQLDDIEIERTREGATRFLETFVPDEILADLDPDNTDDDHRVMLSPRLRVQDVGQYRRVWQDHEMGCRA